MLLFFIISIIMTNYCDYNCMSMHINTLANSSFFLSTMVDSKNLLFASVLMSIVLCIKLFSIYYMDSDDNKKYFYTVFLGFVISMLILLSSNNWILMIIGWDGLGVTSYLLVVFYKNQTSNNSGLYTFVTNRVGDVFLLVFIGILFNYSILMLENKFNSFLFLLVMCLITKSAQFPFSSWLPLAMAAPTPVSALVHSSTLVTAGLFMFYRLDSSFNNSVMIFLFLISLLTSVYSGVGATLETDMKKIIALSTLSQLSFMFLSYSLGLIFLSFLHLLSHALFKASLFFCGGIVIHMLNSEQNLISFSQSVEPMGKSFLMVVTGCLIGFPFSTGFFSKDQILDLMKKNFSWQAEMIFLSAVFLTFMYTLRYMKYLCNTPQNKIFLKKFYFGVYYTSISYTLLMTSMVFMGKYMSENWFKMSFIMVSLGWKTIFMAMFVFFLSLWKMKNFSSSYMASKMMFLTSQGSQIFLKMVWKSAPLEILEKTLDHLNSGMFNWILYSSNFITNNSKFNWSSILIVAFFWIVLFF